MKIKMVSKKMETRKRARIIYNCKRKEWQNVEVEFKKGSA